MNITPNNDMADLSKEKVEEYTLERVDSKEPRTTPTEIAGHALQKVESKDSLHRKNFFNDTEHLRESAYWRSPRLIGSLIAALLLANSVFIAFGMPINASCPCCRKAVSILTPLFLLLCQQRYRLTAIHSS